jgi:hypothetical protein
MTLSGSSLLRARTEHARVTNVELFFDLVFVFAVTAAKPGAPLRQAGGLRWGNMDGVALPG